jgi:hypothetical protein
MLAAMRITAVSDPGLVNSNYRAYFPLLAMERRGHEIAFNRTRTDRFAPGIMSSDVVFIHRYADSEVLSLIHRLKTAGIGVVWDNDDDMMNLPRSNPHYRRFSGMRRKRLIAEITRVVDAVDVVTTPSAVLAERFRSLGARDVRVFENYLPDEFGRTRAHSHDGVTLVWMGALEHQVDYEQLGLRPVFERLLDAHSNLRIVSIGLGLGLNCPRYERIRMVDFMDLADALTIGDIGISPLVDIPWNQARSNVKLKEYAAAGLCWLASPVGPYATLGEKQGGRLVPDDGWHDAIKRLIVKERERRKLAKKATAWARGELIGKHCNRWHALLEDAWRSAQARVRYPGAGS